MPHFAFVHGAPKILFWGGEVFPNLFCVFFIDIFHGIYLPLRHLHLCKDHFSSEEKSEKSKKYFYVRSPDIAPRRDCINSDNLRQPRKYKELSILPLPHRYKKLDLLKTLSRIQQQDTKLVPVEI